MEPKISFQETKSEDIWRNSACIVYFCKPDSHDKELFIS
jgi:hypothetical protein